MFRILRDRQGPGQTGFTVLEVVLALGLGIIVLAGITIGYSYGRRVMIINNQRMEVNAFKTFVENGRASQMAAGKINYGPLLSPEQVCGIINKIPSLKRDPYTGAERLPEAQGVACAGGASTSVSAYVSRNYSDFPTSFTSPITKGTDTGSTATGSGFYYISCDNTVNSTCASVTGVPDSVTFNLVDGSSVGAYGYAVFETDQEGNVVAVAGGEYVAP